MFTASTILSLPIHPISLVHGLQGMCVAAGTVSESPPRAAVKVGDTREVLKHFEVQQKALISIIIIIIIGNKLL